MTIIGFNLAKILLERKEGFTGKIEIKSKADVTDIKKDPMKIAEGKEALRVSFDFLISYEPDFAKVEMKGFVLLLEEPKIAKQILNDWKKKKINNELKERVFNTILSRCNVKALALEEDLNLPPHFPLPQIKREVPYTR